MCKGCVNVLVTIVFQIAMIDLYTWNVPNGRKVSIMLEETGLPYQAHAVDLSKDEQFDPKFVAISPYSKVPVIVDHDNEMTIIESGAILLYLADKSGQFLPESGEAYWRVVEWLMFQIGNVGPLLGQTHHFVHFNPGESPYAEHRYLEQNRRIYTALDRRLAGQQYLAGDYSIADIATWPWIARYEWQTMDLNMFPDLKRWYLSIAERPAVQRGFHVPMQVQELPIPD